MIIDVKVPHVGESITEGVLSTWTRADGDIVQREDQLFELETDKITMPILAEQAGRLSIQVKEGSTVAIGQVVATIDTAAVESAEGGAPSAPDAAKGAQEEEQGLFGPSHSMSAAPKAASVAAGSPAAASASAAAADDEGAGGAAVGALSPAVRRLLEEHQIPASAVAGTGKEGRITKADVLKYVEEHPAPSATARAPKPGVVPPVAAPKCAAPEDAALRQTRKPMSQMRKRIAQRLLEATQQTALVTTFTEADMSRVLALREQWGPKFQEKYGIRLGLMGFMVKAVVDALKFMPDLNARIDGDDIVYFKYYDVGIAVSTENGLLVPVVRDADALSLAQIEQRIAELAARGRERTITLDELTGGVISITNGGVFGSLLSTPIPNPPQSAIVGMHAITRRPVAVGDRVEIRPMMYLALSYDHRLVDGREGVLFLKRVAECLENPERIWMEI